MEENTGTLPLPDTDRGENNEEAQPGKLRTPCGGQIMPRLQLLPGGKRWK